MSNDRETSELLSKSFVGGLTTDEQKSLAEKLEVNEETSTYAKLSRMIQDSVSEVAREVAAGNDTSGHRLSEDAKSRMLTSIRKAKSESIAEQVGATIERGQARTGDGRIAESRFTMIHKIGEGGLGAVWLARDEYLKRTVAIKELLTNRSDSLRHLQRFQREAMITGLLEHPNVVPLYMYGVNSETEKPFYAMRFLGKQTLRDAIEVYHARRRAGQAESIDLHRLLTVFLDVCQAIAYAHSRGVIHRDLKPDNVALDNFGQVIVLDWGIAKLLSDGELAIQASLGPAETTESILTRTVDGEVVGTPLYMAPEQAMGEHDKVDERTDVFGLGAILYAILTGIAPHQESSEKKSSSSLEEVLKSIADAPIPLPTEFDGRIQGDLEAICMRALSHHRYTRHASAQELADDVERWMAGQHEKRKQFEAMRLEGNSIRVGLESCIRDFGTNARFVATLPPIVGLIDSANDVDPEGETVWRERLTTIFQGLLRSNPDFQALTYSRIVDSEAHELVRVEKMGVEAQARSVPRSRLRKALPTPFQEQVMSNKPDDVRVSVELHSTDECSTQLILQAGAPIFDREEEPFGFVAVEGDFHRLLSKHSGKDTFRTLIVDPKDRVLIDHGQTHYDGAAAADLLPGWSEIKQSLIHSADFEDRSRDVYATRVVLCPRAARSFKVVMMREG